MTAIGKEPEFSSERLGDLPYALQHFGAPRSPLEPPSLCIVSPWKHAADTEDIAAAVCACLALAICSEAAKARIDNALAKIGFISDLLSET
jgi:hypothetical protein